MSELDRDTLEDLLALAHQVVIGTTQDTLRADAGYYPALIKARKAYLKARVDAIASIRPLTPIDILGDMYHYGASLQPWNHRIPWNCLTYYDGCNCSGGPYYQMPSSEEAPSSDTPGDSRT